jgi:hypothetical protein
MSQTVRIWQHWRPPQEQKSLRTACDRLSDAQSRELPVPVMGEA